MIKTKFLTTVYHRLSEKYGEQKWWPGETTDEIIIGALLTQNTNWNNAAKAIQHLKDNGLCSLESLKSEDTDKIAHLIRPSGYYNVKAKRLKNLCREINKAELNRLSLDQARKALLDINGVGSETADSILLYAFNRPVFVIDAYTVRLFQRLLPGNEKKSYSELQQMFHYNLPPAADMFNEYHALIVRHGKTHCKKNRPLCGTCPLIDQCCYASSKNDKGEKISINSTDYIQTR